MLKSVTGPEHSQKEIAMDVIKQLQNWYEENCDGYWEHQYGIKIDTLDNPGWMIKIDLNETNLEDSSFEFNDIEKADDDWVHCRVVEKVFEAAGGPENLEEILTIFLTWAENVRNH